MTPKEKAKELVKKYIQFRIDGRACVFGLALSKQFALIAVDEILLLCNKNKIVYSEFTDNTLSEYTEDYYWEQVKHEIEKL